MVETRGRRKNAQGWGGETGGVGGGGRPQKKKELSEDERIERRGDGKPNQFSLVVIPIRRQP